MLWMSISLAGRTPSGSTGADPERVCRTLPPSPSLSFIHQRCQAFGVDSPRSDVIPARPQAKGPSWQAVWRARSRIFVRGGDRYPLTVGREGDRIRRHPRPERGIGGSHAGELEPEGAPDRGRSENQELRRDPRLLPGQGQARPDTLQQHRRRQRSRAGPGGEGLLARGGRGRRKRTEGRRGHASAQALLRLEGAGGASSQWQGEHKAGLP